MYYFIDVLDYRNENFFYHINYGHIHEWTIGPLVLSSLARGVRK